MFFFGQYSSSNHCAIQVNAEAFSGLAMIAVNEGRVLQAISYATAAVSKHADALPLVACVRLAAAVRRVSGSCDFCTLSLALVS
jgi:hypothetical protein